MKPKKRGRKKFWPRSLSGNGHSFLGITSDITSNERTWYEIKRVPKTNTVRWIQISSLRVERYTLKFQALYVVKRLDIAQFAGANAKIQTMLAEEPQVYTPFWNNCSIYCSRVLNAAGYFPPYPIRNVPIGLHNWLLGLP